ncbi:MAG: hypothetical protein MR508_00740 [Lachnospiraceae bacterium]|nr:hypothetical protein [Lachnospiraceae bacterium]
MAGKVISFKIGDSVTHVAEVDYEAKTPKVYHAFTFETPEGILDDNGVNVTESFVNMVKQGMSESGIQNNRVVFTMTSGRVANREITIPLVKETKIKSLLMANSKDYFPVDLAQYQLVYRVISTDKAQKQMALSVYAVPNTLINSYQTLAKALDLQLVAIDYYGNSIYQAMTHSMSPELSASICIDDNTSMITIIKDSKVILQRNIGYGIDDAVFAMRESTLVKPGATYIQALTQMQMNLCFNEQLRPKTVDTAGAPLTAKDKITSSLTMLVNNISRVLDYFASRNTDVEINHISLVGLGADCQGLDRLLTNELGVDVTTVKSFGSSDVTRSLSAQRFHLAEYYSCIGAAISPLNFTLAEKEKAAEKESVRLPIIICGGCVAIAVVVVVTGLMSNLLLSASNRQLQNTIKSKQPVIDTYNQYITDKVIHDGVVAIEQSSNTPNDAFLDLIAEMEKKLPADLVVTNMSVADSSISLSLTCASKESAAETLISLRNFDTVENVTCSGIAEQEGDNGVKKVTFSVTVTYKPVVVESTEPIADEQTQETQQ